MCLCIAGFGDSASTLIAVIGDSSMPYRCVASLPGVPVARTEVIFPRLTGPTCTLFFFYRSIHSWVKYINRSVSTVVLLQS